MKLYTYYRSQASFRVRIALNLKGIVRDDSFLHLEKGDQFAAEYRARSNCFSRWPSSNISTRSIRIRRCSRATRRRAPGCAGSR